MFKNSKQHYDSKTNKTDSVIYFNANIYNNPVTNNQQAKIARFNQSISSGSIVDLPENYYMAIVRFAISHALIPLYQFKNNFYSVTISRRDGTDPQREFLQYTRASPANINAYSQFGYTNPVFSYEQFLNSVNIALAQAFQPFLADPNQTISPSITYDTALEKFVINIPAQWYEDSNSIPLYYISMNANLFQQFQFFRSSFNGYNQDFGRDFDIITNRYPIYYNLVGLVVASPNPAVAPFPNDVYRFYQERSALYLLNEVQSIVFTSTTLNVTKEFTGRNDGSGTAGTIAILADFVPDQSTGRDLSEYQYNVQGPPRLVNLTNTIPITDIDYQVGIRFRDGTIVPLYLEPGETCEVKFGFFKKSLYDNNFEY